jgi:hypothetical protein
VLCETSTARLKFPQKLVDLLGCNLYAHPMKVHELIAELSHLPQYADVIVSSDPEGNSYNPAYEVTLGSYYPDDDEFYPVHPDDLDDDEVIVGVYIYP